MLAGDGAKVLDQAVDRLRQVEHLGFAIDLHPRAVPVVGKDEHRDLWVSLGVAALRPGRIGGDDDPTLRVDTAGDRRDLRAAVATGGGEQETVAGTDEVHEL